MSDSTFTNLLIHSVDIQRRGEGAVNDLGLPDEILTTVASGVKCLIQDVKGTFILQKEGKEISVDSIIFFEYDTDIQEDDIIVFGTEKYTIDFIENAAGQNHHLEVGARLL